VADGVSVCGLLNDCLDLLHFKAESKGLSLSYHLHEEFPETIRTDQNRLKQVLINLISNSLKYTESGYVKVEALIDEGHLRFDVVDTGVGI
jgi:signal transduction histidine kinase